MNTRRMMSANDKQISGKHYNNKAIQPWDFIIANNIGYLEGNAIKYIVRYKEKNGLVDLEKALHYIEKLIETEKDKLSQSEKDSTKEIVVGSQVKCIDDDGACDIRRGTIYTIKNIFNDYSYNIKSDSGGYGDYLKERFVLCKS